MRDTAFGSEVRSESQQLSQSTPRSGDDGIEPLGPSFWGGEVKGLNDTHSESIQNMLDLIPGLGRPTYSTAASLSPLSSRGSMRRRTGGRQRADALQSNDPTHLAQILLRCTTCEAAIDCIGGIMQMLEGSSPPVPTPALISAIIDTFQHFRHDPQLVIWVLQLLESLCDLYPEHIETILSTLPRRGRGAPRRRHHLSPRGEDELDQTVAMLTTEFSESMPSDMDDHPPHASPALDSPSEGSSHQVSPVAPFSHEHRPPILSQFLRGSARVPTRNALNACILPSLAPPSHRPADASDDPRVAAASLCLKLLHTGLPESALRDIIRGMCALLLQDDEGGGWVVSAEIVYQGLQLMCAGESGELRMLLAEVRGNVLTGILAAACDDRHFAHGLRYRSMSFIYTLSLTTEGCSALLQCGLMNCVKRALRTAKHQADEGITPMLKLLHGLCNEGVAISALIGRELIGVLQAPWLPPGEAQYLLATIAKAAQGGPTHMMAGGVLTGLLDYALASDMNETRDRVMAVFSVVVGGRWDTALHADPDAAVHLCNVLPELGTTAQEVASRCLEHFAHNAIGCGSLLQHPDALCKVLGVFTETLDEKTRKSCFSVCLDVASQCSDGEVGIALASGMVSAVLQVARQYPGTLSYAHTALAVVSHLARHCSSREAIVSTPHAVTLLHDVLLSPSTPESVVTSALTTIALLAQIDGPRDVLLSKGSLDTVLSLQVSSRSPPLVAAFVKAVVALAGCTDPLDDLRPLLATAADDPLVASVLGSLGRNVANMVSSEEEGARAVVERDCESEAGYLWGVFVGCRAMLHQESASREVIKAEEELLWGRAKAAFDVRCMGQVYVQESVALLVAREECQRAAVEHGERDGRGEILTETSSFHREHALVTEALLGKRALEDAEQVVWEGIQDAAAVSGSAAALPSRPVPAPPPINSSELGPDTHVLHDRTSPQPALMVPEDVALECSVTPLSPEDHPPPPHEEMSVHQDSPQYAREADPQPQPIQATIQHQHEMVDSTGPQGQSAPPHETTRHQASHQHEMVSRPSREAEPQPPSGQLQPAPLLPEPSPSQGAPHSHQTADHNPPDPATAQHAPTLQTEKPTPHHPSTLQHHATTQVNPGRPAQADDKGTQQAVSPPQHHPASLQPIPEAVSPPPGEPPLAEPPLAEPPLAEPPLAEPRPAHQPEQVSPPHPKVESRPPLDHIPIAPHYPSTAPRTTASEPTSPVYPPEAPSRAEEAPSRAEEAPSRAEEAPSRAEEAPSRAEEAPSRAEEAPSCAVACPPPALQPKEDSSSSSTTAPPLPAYLPHPTLPLDVLMRSTSCSGTPLHSERSAHSGRATPPTAMLRRAVCSPLSRSLLVDDKGRPIPPPDHFLPTLSLLVRLCDDMDIPESERASYASHLRTVHIPGSVSWYKAIERDTIHLQRCRSAVLEVLHAINIREGYLSRLRELHRAYSESPVRSTRYGRQAMASVVGTTVTQLEESSVEVVRAVRRWKDLVGTAAPFMWKGGSYLEKMADDTSFLRSSPLKAIFGGQEPFRCQLRGGRPSTKIGPIGMFTRMCHHGPACSVCRSLDHNRGKLESVDS